MMCLDQEPLTEQICQLIFAFAPWAIAFFLIAIFENP